jgi:hypothetical protein
VIKLWWIGHWEKVGTVLGFGALAALPVLVVLHLPTACWLAAAVAFAAGALISVHAPFVPRGGWGDDEL